MTNRKRAKKKEGRGEWENRERKKKTCDVDGEMTAGSAGTVEIGITGIMRVEGGTASVC